MRGGAPAQHPPCPTQWATARHSLVATGAGAAATRAAGVSQAGDPRAGRGTPPPHTSCSSRRRATAGAETGRTTGGSVEVWEWGGMKLLFSGLYQP